MKFPCYDTDDIFEPPSSGGISLTVAYLPGFEVDVVPLLEVLVISWILFLHGSFSKTLTRLNHILNDRGRISISL